MHHAHAPPALEVGLAQEFTQGFTGFIGAQTMQVQFTL